MRDTTRRPRRLASLGDSFSCGEGVGVQVPLQDTWCARLARALGYEHAAIAVPGARVRDVRRSQLPLTLDADPDLATVLVGLNDVGRPGYDRAGIAEDLDAVVATLRYAGVRVLLCRLPEPPALQVFPGRVRERWQQRIGDINGIVDQLASLDGVASLDLQLTGRTHWAIDRLHPNALGHRTMADHATSSLALHARAGAVVTSPAAAPAPLPSRSAELRWVVRHALPWLAWRTPAMLLPLVVDADRALHRHNGRRR